MYEILELYLATEVIGRAYLATEVIGRAVSSYRGHWQSCNSVFYQHM